MYTKLIEYHESQLAKYRAMQAEYNEGKANVEARLANAESLIEKYRSKFGEIFEDVAEAIEAMPLVNLLPVIEGKTYSYNGSTYKCIKSGIFTESKLEEMFEKVVDDNETNFDI